MDNQALVVEREFDAPKSKIWNAISDKNEMKKWYFDLPEFKAEAGCKFQFSGGPSPEKQYVHLCEVTEAIPENKLTYSWRYEGYSGNSFVTFELFEQNQKTLLRLTHIGLESFPAENPDFAKANFSAGWNSIIHTLLKEFLEK
jgi:uncharacterized protein YndB with AHSA1/START domain